MYSSEKNPGINWKDLIIKAIFLVIFLLLLVWLFPKVPNMKPFYSNVFRENIRYMQDAAESYYTNERLPKNIGDSAEMTLQEMINKNLIIPFVDEDGNDCDTYSSYVSIKKNKDDYTLKVNLVCPKESNYVEKTLGCYDYCDGNNCTQELEYQYKKETTADKTLYSCPNGGTLSNGLCYLYGTDSYKATATTSKGEYYCPNGGELKGSKCYVTATDSYEAPNSAGEYYCPDGGRLDGIRCYVTDTSTYRASRTSGEYYCPDGGKLQDGRCHVIDGDSYDATMKVNCAPGERYLDGICIGGTAGGTKTVPASIKNYTCPDGKVQSSPDCITSTAGKTIDATPVAGKTIDATPNTEAKTLKTTKTQGNGYTLISSGYEYTCSNHALCPKRVYYYYYRYYKTTYECPKNQGYTLSGTKCVKETTYKCPENQGYTLSGTKCIKSGTTNPVQGTPNYYCPNGRLDSTGKNCIIDNDSSYSYKATITYDCPKGGNLKGTKCVIDKSYSYKASKSEGERYCPDGGELNGANCVIDNSYNYRASRNPGAKYCPETRGGTLVGNSCIIDKSYNYNASKTNGNTVYTCPNGGELKDKSCYVSKISSSYKATATTKKVTSVSYKWSKEDIAGWTKTGESRVVASSLVVKN